MIDVDYSEGIGFCSRLLKKTKIFLGGDLTKKKIHTSIKIWVNHGDKTCIINMSLSIKFLKGSIL